MLLYKDEKKLNKAFPCMAEEYILKKEDNNSESYHYHDFYEITYVQEGSGEYSVNGQNYVMNEKDLIIFNNVEPHGWTVSTDEMKVIVVTFSPDLVSDPGNVFSGEYIRPFIERGSTFKNRVDAKDKNAVVIAEIVKDIFELYSQSNNASKVASIMKKDNRYLRNGEKWNESKITRIMARLSEV